jgi:hypothetical protein
VVTRALGAFLVVCVLVLPARAGNAKYKRPPSQAATSQAMIDAEAAWAAADALADARAEAAAWEVAAEAFLAVAEDPKAAAAERKEAAYAAVLAWKNALNVDPRVKTPGAVDDGRWDRVPEPTPLSPQEERLLRAFDVYLALGAFADPDEVPGIVFLRGNILRRHHRYTEAEPWFQTIIDDHPRHETAEYAANALLDMYILGARYDELAALAARLHADTAFLAGRADLAERLEDLLARIGRKAAEALEKAARETGEWEAYHRCGEAYLALYAEAKQRADADELRYNAGVCFEEAKEMDAALAAYAAVMKQNARSGLATRARARAAVVEARRARYAEAAALLEAYVVAAMDGAPATRPMSRDDGGVSRRSSDKDVVDAANDAVYYALALGDTKRAARVVDAVGTALARDGEQRLLAETAIVQAMHGRGARAAAKARVKLLVGSAGRARGASSLAAAGRVVAAVACPVALVDELCPRPRDKALAASARALFERAAKQAERGQDQDAIPGDAEDARRRVLDLALEPLLAAKKPAAASVAALERGYQALVDDHAGTYASIVASERLGRMRRVKAFGLDRARAVDAYRRCVALARDAGSGADFLATCERGLAAEAAPDADLLPERLPAPALATVPVSTEGP